MTDHDLAQQLQRLRRRVEQLQAEFQRQRLDEGLFAEMENLMENGLTADDRCTELRRLVDGLREGHLVPRSDDHNHAVRACVRMKIMIDRVVGDLAK